MLIFLDKFFLARVGVEEKATSQSICRKS